MKKERKTSVRNVFYEFFMRLIFQSCSYAECIDTGSPCHLGCTSECILHYKPELITF